MWHLRFKVKNVDNIYSHLTEGRNVIDYFYPVDKYKKNGLIYIFGIHVFFGDPKDVADVIKKLKKHKRVEKIEINNNRVTMLYAEEEKFYEHLFDQELYFPKPVVIKNGIEEWDIASWDRNKLNELMEEIEKWPKKLLDFELQGIKKGDLKDIYFPRVVPEVPEKQRRAFRLAVKHGYYKFPRKITLEGLAKKMEISTQTYHEHLRKAEARLLPFFSEDIDLEA